MTPKVLAKWILLFGGGLSLVASLVYLAVLIWYEEPAPVPVQAVVDISQYKLAERGPRPEGFVGSKACQECHAEEYAEYASHPMAKSAAFMSDVAPIEDYEHPPHVVSMNKRFLTTTFQDGKVRHHERLEDGNGLVYDMSVPIDLEFGSGKRGRSFITNHDGVMFMSPLTWYSTSKSWGLSPGFTPQRNPRFSRRIVDGCIQCHAGQVVRRPDHPDQLQAPYFHEVAIGCERCHGPGESHIAYRRVKDQPAGSVDPIVNPIKLEPARREAVCNQCHLQGLDRIPQLGRSEYDFRAGDLLADVWVTFVSGTRLNDQGTQAVSQVEQMESSQCFQKSAGAMGCMSCHSAHSVPALSDLPKFYRQKCSECHAAGKTECSLPLESPERQKVADSCIACHMPTIPTNNVPHTAATDHRIQRKPKPLTEEPTVDDKRFQPYREFNQTLPEVELRRARGIYLARLAERGQDGRLADDCLDLLQPILLANPTDVDALMAVGTAYWVQGNLREAERHWDRVLMISPNHERALGNLAVICHDAGVFQEGLAYIGMLIEANPWRPELYGRQAHMLGRLGKLDEGIQAAKKGLELDPGLEQMHGWLSEVYSLQGKKEQALEHQRIHRRMLGAPQ